MHGILGERRARCSEVPFVSAAAAEPVRTKFLEAESANQIVVRYAVALL